MKSIKSAKWDVYIHGVGSGRCQWTIDTRNSIGVKSDFPSERSFVSSAATRKNWEQFAKVNGIKNWRYA